MCLYGSIHSSYHLTHEMVLMYLVRTLFVHSCRTHNMSEYKSTTHDSLLLPQNGTERMMNEVPTLQSKIVRPPNARVVVVLLPQEG